VEKGIDILCEGDRIEAVGPGLEAPDGARIIEAPGMCALPGLIDAHVHLDDGFEVSPIYMFLAWGVTTVRDFENAGLRIKGLRELIDSGELLGPRIVYSAEAVSWGRKYSPFQIQARTAAAARAAVQKVAGDGADFIFLASGVTAEIVDAAQYQAALFKLPLAVDLLENMEVDAMKAARLGVNSLERLGGVPQAILSKGIDIHQPSALYHWLQKDDTKEELLLRELAKRRVFLVPTLASFEKMALPAAGALKESEATRGLQQTTWDSWREQRAIQDRLTWWAPACHLHFLYSKKFIGHAARVGVKIATGSGTPTPGLPPGYGLLREIELLVESGLKPAEALRAATVDAAECVGKRFELGLIEKGRLADIIIVEGNPLHDLSHLKKLKWVIKGGHVVERREIPGFGK
jgi:imidazolonepropionase-like amidohydrolase